MNILSRQKGFSLIEIMVVLVIMGLLAGIVVPNVMEALINGRRNKVVSDIKGIETGLKMYKLDNHIYPRTEQGLEALIEKTDISPLPKNWREEGYLAKLPLDPWENEYLYTSPNDEGKPYEIYSLGADGARGGENEDADLSSLQ